LYSSAEKRAHGLLVVLAIGASVVVMNHSQIMVAGSYRVNTNPVAPSNFTDGLVGAFKVGLNIPL